MAKALFYLSENSFKAGDLVRWKNGLKNRIRPEYNQPAIVIALLETPVLPPEEASGSAYFREPLDIILGVLSDDNELICFHFDKRRFELCTKTNGASRIVRRGVLG